MNNYSDGVYEYIPRQFLDLTGDFTPLTGSDKIEIKGERVIINDSIDGFCLAEAMICGKIGEKLNDNNQ